MTNEQILKNKEKIIEYYFEKENFKFTKGINHKLTSEKWAKIISKWSGLTIQNDDIILFCKKHNITGEEICTDLYCFGIFK